MYSTAKLRQELALTMQEYARKQGIDIDVLCDSLYQKYGITSRTELSEVQLKKCIKYYRDGIRFEDANPVEVSFQKLLDEHNSREKRERNSTGMQSVVQLFLDHPDKIWWWSYEIMGRANSKKEWISHRGPARASDLAIHNPDIVEDRKIGRLAIYRLKRENMKEVEKFLNQ